MTLFLAFSTLAAIAIATWALLRASDWKDKWEAENDLSEALGSALATARERVRLLEAEREREARGQAGYRASGAGRR